MTFNAVDNPGSQQLPADLQLSLSNAASAAMATSKDSYEVAVDGLQLRLNRDYTFSFRYLLQNEDPDDKSQNFGPYSPAFVVTAAEIYAALPDNRTIPTNVTTTNGFNSYQVKWDKPTFEGYVDTIVWESPTNTFTSSSTVVYVGTSTQINILTSNTDTRYVKIIHRDKFLHANIDPSLDTKYFISGPITPKDPVVVDTTGPGNVSGVFTTGGIDETGYLGFNGYADITWSAVTGGDIRGYRIRFKPTTSSVYSYADSTGTATAYRLTGLAVGVTYNIEVATYDQYNNTSTSYVAGTNVQIPGTPTMSGYITAGAFKFGDGVVAGKRGLHFNNNNYWYINSGTTAEFKVGGPTSNYISWDGSELKVNGNLGVDGSTTIGGNIQLTTTGASIYNGVINAAGNLTGDGFALNSSGLKVAKGSSSVTINSADGTITANAGSIGGWTLGASTLSKNNITLDSAGQIRAGSDAAKSVYIDSTNLYPIAVGSTTYYRLWSGNNNPGLANFKVDSAGKLYATGAVIDGAASIAGTVLINGTAGSTVVSNASTALSTANTASTTATAASNTATAASTAATNAAALAATKLTKSANTIADSSNNITGINTNGITVFANGATPTSIPSSGARVIMNSAGIAAYDSTSTTNSNGVTFSLSASNGNAYFKGEVQATSGKFTGEIQASSGKFIGEINANSGYLGSAANGWTFDSTGNLSNGTAGSLSATTIFPKANSVAIGVLGNSNTISYYSNRGIIVNPGTGSAFGYSVFGTGLITLSGTNPQLSSSIPVRINDSFAPNSDNSYSLGFTDARWQIVRSFNGVSTTSDQRLKTEIQDSSLGLDFIKQLRPVSYKFISGGKVYKDGAQKEIVDGVIVEPERVDRPGVRTHWGFIAQEVKEAIDNAGVEDFGGWQLDDISDPNSSQSLVHHQFIGPMTKAIQELSDMVESLQQEVNTLKGI